MCQQPQCRKCYEMFCKTGSTTQLRIARLELVDLYYVDKDFLSYWIDTVNPILSKNTSEQTHF